MQIFGHKIKYLVVFLGTVILLTGLLVLVAMIPQSAIKQNVLESAEFLCEEELFGTVIEGVEGSKIDHYADSILLAIAWQYDGEHPVKSVMTSSYYYTEYQNENKNLLDAVTNDLESNQQYLRYWHGSNAIVRPLLLILNIQQIYLLNGIVMAVLIIWLLGMFFRRKEYLPALAVLMGLVMTAFWFVPLSLEYTWTYLLMLIVSIVGVKLARLKKWNCMGMLFLLSGVITNFLDFLTTETLTLLVPLLLILWVDMHENRSQRTSHLFSKSVKAVVAWTCGYAGMWVMKWMMASILLQKNVMLYVTGHVKERIGGDIGVGLWSYVTNAVWRNVKCLFPFEYGNVGLLAGIAILFLASYVGYVHQKNKINKERILLYMAIGMIPYIRYMIFHNHSYLHCFFTYRAQMATIMGVVMIVAELTEWRWNKPFHRFALDSYKEKNS